MIGRIDWKRGLAAVGTASLLSWPALAAYGGPALTTAKQPIYKDNQGFPTRRVGGGTRCGPEQACPGPDVLIALIPERLVETTDPFPTFYFYIPALKTSQPVQLEFVLRDEKDRLAYETTFTATGKAGIVPLQLAPTPTFSGLSLRKNYHWYLSLIYNPRDRSRDDVVEGWIKYISVPAELTSQLGRSTPEDRVELYQEAGLWHEAIATAAELKRSRPQDPAIAQMWRQVLQGADLQRLAPLANAEVR